jgi:plasmid rolling circle replication initiator protein Rep
MPDFAGDSDLYLSDLSTKDKPWDEHRFATDLVQKLYSRAGLYRYAERTGSCSWFLTFALESQDTEEFKLKLKSARFCRVRTCPVCQWRRAMMWRARFIKALPAITEAYPTARWLFLTLTVRNCPLYELRPTLREMNRGWVRMIERKAFPALGFVKSVEVTRGADGSAHPHFHCLLLVPSSYFSTGYISQAKWTELWRDAARLEYQPIVNVKAVKAGKGVTDPAGVLGAVLETMKYTVKTADLVSDETWLAELTTQLHKSRAVSIGGVLKNFIRDSEPDDLINADEEPEILENNAELFFQWNRGVNKYVKFDH